MCSLKQVEFAGVGDSTLGAMEGSPNVGKAVGDEVGFWVGRRQKMSCTGAGTPPVARIFPEGKATDQL